MRTSKNRHATVTMVAIITAIAAAAVSRYAQSADPLMLEEEFNRIFGIGDETDKVAIIDYGPGPGDGRPVESGAIARERSDVTITAPQVPVGPADANAMGVFGAAISWPVIPIHMVVLPDRRLLSYGTNELGQQGAELYYDVWDPSLGTGSSAHMVLSNTTGTDIFCSTQAVMQSGEVLVSGGDLTVDGKRESANIHTNIFSPTANDLTQNTSMHYPRYYASLVSLWNGRLAVFGGRKNIGVLRPAQPVTEPERYDPETRAWTTLTGAASPAAFDYWFYPRAYAAPGGNVFVLGSDGKMFSISTGELGTVTALPGLVEPETVSLPTIPFAPGKVLSVRNSSVVVVDYTQAAPVVTSTDNTDQVRHWSSGTVLADGQVLLTGGSKVINELIGVDYQAEIWNPATGHWTAAASATKPRLYHSNAILLPDGTVLTGGGGAPGPVTNLNAEIFYPPYLYTAGGAAAIRPTIESAEPLSLHPGGVINIVMGEAAAARISRVTFVRTGSATHSYNPEQRFVTLGFTQSGQNITAALPSDPTELVPGFYMLFAFNADGAPSVSKIIKVE